MTPAQALAEVVNRTARVVRHADQPQKWTCHARLLSALYVMSDGSAWIWFAAHHGGDRKMRARVLPLAGVRPGAPLGTTSCPRCGRGCAFFAVPTGVRPKWTPAPKWRAGVGWVTRVS